MRVKDYRVLLLLSLIFFKSSSTDWHELLHNSEGKVGLYALNTATQKRISHNDQELFPMGNMHTVMLACYLFKQVHEGTLSLQQPISIAKEHIAPGAGVIKADFKEDSQPKSYPLIKLIEYMITESDSTAAHCLMTLAGGHRVIDAWLETNGIKNIIFKTDLKSWLTQHALKVMRYAQGRAVILASDHVPLSVQAACKAASWLPEPKTIDFSDETTNIATPEHMVMFLQKLLDKKNQDLITHDHRKLLLGFMKSCKTGTQRVPKYLDKSCTVMHKTGSGIMGFATDAGIIKSDSDRIIFALFVKNSKQPMKELDELLAQLGKHIYEELKSTPPTI